MFAERVKVYNYGRYLTSHLGKKKSECSRNYANGSNAEIMQVIEPHLGRPLWGLLEYSMPKLVHGRMNRRVLLGVPSGVARDD